MLSEVRIITSVFMCSLSEEGNKKYSIWLDWAHSIYINKKANWEDGGYMKLGLQYSSFYTLW